MKQHAHLASILLSWLAVSAAQAGQLNDTGQIACYDATSVTGTVSSGTPAPESPGFEGQDCSLGAAAADAVGVQVKLGGSSVKGRDYTKIATNGSELPDTAQRGTNPTDWACTRDNVTGLTWLLSFPGFESYRYAWKSNAPDPNFETNTCGGQLPTCNTDSLAQVVNALNVCGISTWTLPTPGQLESLFAYDDAGSPANLIDRVWFPDQSNDGPGAFTFWTDTPQDTQSPPTVWTADFGAGWIGIAGAQDPARVRFVSGGSPAPAIRFTTSAPGPAGEMVVEDAHTGLMWKQCPEGLSGSGCAAGGLSALTWQGALQAASGASFAGFTDWRLPTIIELASIRDYTAIAATEVGLPSVFAGTSFTEVYWSSTSDPVTTTFDTALTYQFGGTTAHLLNAKGSGAAVRLVRAGNFLARHAPGAGTSPAAFSFPAVNADAGSLVESAEVILQTFTGPTSLRITGTAESAYRLNDGPWMSSIGVAFPGDRVRVRHRASNQPGTALTSTLTVGATSAAFVSTAVATPPGPPLNVVATRGDRRAFLAFDAPANDGGAPITAYSAVSEPAGGTSSCEPAPARSCTVSNLTVGQSYTFRVTASSSNGPSAPSAPSNAITAATVPAAMTSISATAGNGVATVTFPLLPSEENGGDPITEYALNVFIGESSTGFSCGTTSPCQVTGLSNGTSYRFRVSARNAIGFGPASQLSNAVTPGIAPTIQFIGSPRLLVPGNYNRGLLRLGAVVDQTLEIGDGDNSLDSLVITVQSTNAALFPASTDAATGGFVIRRNGNRALVSLRPAISTSGTSTVTYTVTDPTGRSASTAPISLVVPDFNTAPSASYVKGIRLPAGSTAGEYTVPNFVMSSSVGSPDEVPLQSLEHLVFGLANDGNSFVPITATVDAAGTLRMQLDPTSSPTNFIVDLYAWPRDDGTGDRAKCAAGDAWPSQAAARAFALYNCVGGCSTSEDAQELTQLRSEPCGEASQIPIVKGNAVVVSAVVARRAPEVVASPAKADGLPIGYTIRVQNVGGAAVAGVTISVNPPSGLGSPTWTCSVPQGACRPATGSGRIATAVDLDLDAEATITLTGVVNDTTAYLPLIVNLALPAGVEGTLIGSGNLKVDVLSDSYIHYGSFEGTSR